MVDIQPPTAEIRRGKKKKKEERKKKPQGNNTVACPIYRAAIKKLPVGLHLLNTIALRPQSAVLRLILTAA